MRSRLTLLFISLIVGGALVEAQQGRAEAPLTFGADVALVVFNVTVTDAKGRHVAGLTARDFQVDEDGRAQHITQFDADDLPATVGLVVDSSGSMVDKRPEVIKAALAFVAASNPLDEMFVVNFNEHSYLGLPPEVPFTSDVQQIHAALMQRPPTALTALYDALALGIDQLKASRKDRKALVVLSDGGDNASTKSGDDVLFDARRSSATIYTIGMYDETNRDKDPRTLRKIADATGGRAFFPRDLEDVDRVWQDMAGGIRAQYTLGYRSSNDARNGLFRKVKITATRAGKHDLRVAARDGYFALPPAVAPR